MSGRTRNWLFIVYPESAPDCWQEFLSRQNVPFCVSPLHDRDLTDLGELKKPHYHCALCFDGLKSSDQVRSFTDLINATNPIPALSLRSSIRYFCHLDSPDKFKYSIDDMRSFCGFNHYEFLNLSISEELSIMRDIVNCIDYMGFTEYSTFLRYCIDNHYADWFPIITKRNHAYTIHSYLASVRNLKFKKEILK